MWHDPWAQGDLNISFTISFGMWIENKHLPLYNSLSDIKEIFEHNSSTENAAGNSTCGIRNAFKFSGPESMIGKVSNKNCTKFFLHILGQ
jgi:hypothetical protein